MIWYVCLLYKSYICTSALTQYKVYFYVLIMQIYNILHHIRYFFSKYRLYILCILGIFLCLFLYGKSINISNTAIKDQYNNLRERDFDDFYSTRKDQFVYTFDLNLAFSKDRKLIIHPNDCISKVLINGGEYVFEKKQDLCDKEDGVLVDLSRYAHIGKNFINIHMQQRWHGRSIILSVDGRDGVQFTVFIIMTWLLWVMITGMIFTTNLPKNYKIILSVLFAVVLWLSYTYFANSFYTKWSHDAYWHIDYIKIMVNGNFLPSANQCRVCYHPPIYYFLSAIIYKISQFLHILNPYIVIRRAGMILYTIIGLFFGIRFLYLVFQRKPIAFWCSTLLLLFWPLNYYYGPRIINDNLFYMFSFIFLYLLVSRYKHGSKIFETHKNIPIRTFIVLILWLFTKSNFIIWLPLLLITIYKNFSLRDNDKWLFKKSLMNNIKKGYVYYIYAIAIVVWYMTFQAIFKSKEIVGNVSIFWLIGYIWDVDLFRTFTSFDYNSFIHNTKWRWNQSLDESEFFWNYIFKSMMYSEIGVYEKFKTLLAQRLNFIFFIFIILVFINLFKSSKEKLFYVVGFIVPIVSMMIYRWIYPYIASMNYRYIFPHILFFLYFLVEDIQLANLKNIKIITYMKILLIGIFVGLCIMFSLPPYY